MRQTSSTQCFLTRFQLVFAVPLLAVGCAYGEAAEPNAADPTAASEVATKPAAKSSGITREPLLFPRDWARGFSEIQYAPPHNEPDLGRCLSSTGAYGGVNAPCANYARYVFSGYVEIHPFGRTPLRRLFFFADPKFFFGNTVPQYSYTHAFNPIAYESTLGAAIELPRNFELRVVRHSVRWMGRYEQPLGPADIGSGGPYGSYSMMGVRWYFGGYGHVHSVQ
jgi:hypothetical protein